MSDKQYDVIIIGAGVSGLITGAYLSKEYHVLILERNPFIGGLCSTLKLDDTTWFNVGAHFLPDRFADEPFIEQIFDDFPEYRRYFRDLLVKIPLGIIDGKKLFWIKNEIDFFDSLLRTFPKSKVELVNFNNKFNSIKSQLSKLMQGNMNCDFSILKDASVDLLEAIDSIIISSELKKLITGPVLWPGGDLGFLIMYLDMYFQGIYGIKGGVAPFFKIFGRIIEENQGEILLNKEVTNIISENGIAIGCKTYDGLEFFGRRIISSISPRKLYSELLSQNEACVKYGEQLTNIPVASSAIQVTLLIDGEINEYAGGYYVVLPESYEELRNWYQDTERRKVNNRCVIWVFISDNNMKMCSQGKTLIQIIMPVYGDLYFNLSNQERNKITEAMKNELFRIIPSIKNKIIYEETWTPSNYMEIFGNDEGSALAWHLSVPITKKPRRKCRIMKNLYLIGHWIFFGGLPGVFRKSKGVAEMVKDELNIETKKDRNANIN